eukprot:g9888.t1
MRTISTITLTRGAIVGVAAVLVFSLLFGTYLYDAIDGTYSFVGAFSSKNQLGFYASVGLFFCYAGILIFRLRGLWFLLAGAVSLVSAYSLLASQSATSVITTVAVVAVCIGMQGFMILSPKHRRLFFSAAVVLGIGAVVGALQFGAMDAILGIFGKDSTLTGRTYLWQQGIIAAGQHPLFGMGYQGFWVPGYAEAERLWQDFFITGKSGFHFHNTYIEGMVETGAVGTLMLVFILLALLTGYLKRLLTIARTPDSLLFFGITSLLLIRSFVEIDIINPYHVGSFLQGEVNRMQTLFSIQYLRAVAALAVVVFHAGERTGLHFTIGAAGVDVFFVVSGFIMMAISDQRPTSPIAFIRHRVLRIAPAYWAATTVMIAAAMAGLFPNLRLDPIHILGSFLFFPVPSPNGGNLWPVLVQGWTLNYEMFFYVVFALVLLLRPSARLAALAAVFCTLTLAGLWLRPENPVAIFYTAPVVLEFVAGAALARLWQKGGLPSFFAGLVLVGLSIAGFAAIQLLKLEFDAWTCGPLAVMLVLGALAVEASGKLPKLSALTYLGDSSYSIYLWHTFAVSVVVQVGAALTLSPPVLLVAAVALGTLVGIAGYECFERPVNALLRGRPVLPWWLPVRRRPAQ